MLKLGRIASAIHRSAIRIAAALLIGGLVTWLALDRPNPWLETQRIRRVTVNDADAKALQADIGAAIRTTLGPGKVNVNSIWESDALNVYVLNSGATGLEGWGIGGASYEPRNDVILVDKHVAWPYITEPSYSATRTSASQTRSVSDKLWLQFIVLHEVGHRTLHRNVDFYKLRDAQYRRTLEDEADTFAFKHLATLINTESTDSNGRLGLFSRSTIAELPEPDRSAAIVASLIQEFSVSLLFSNASASTYYSDTAHKAFAERFRPRLSELLSNAKTKQGKVFVLLALEAVQRVEDAGRNVVAEIISQSPIESASFNENGLEIISLKDEKTAEQKRFQIASSVLSKKAGEPVKRIELEQFEATPTATLHSSSTARLIFMQPDTMRRARS